MEPNPYAPGSLEAIAFDYNSRGYTSGFGLARAEPGAIMPEPAMSVAPPQPQTMILGFGLTLPSVAAMKINPELARAMVPPPTTAPTTKEAPMSKQGAMDAVLDGGLTGDAATAMLGLAGKFWTPIAVRNAAVRLQGVPADQLPSRVAELAKSDPEGFGRLVKPTPFTPPERHPFQWLAEKVNLANKAKGLTPLDPYKTGSQGPK
jgi:hypothetical protein